MFVTFLVFTVFQQSLHTQSKSMENSFYQESQLLQERESLSEQRRRFYQEKANFEEERRNFTEAAIQLGKQVSLGRTKNVISITVESCKFEVPGTRDFI